MIQWIRHLGGRWANWCGDRDLENAIRGRLTHEGYYGRTAKLHNVRLVAVARPGWVQIYRFDVTARVAAPDPGDTPLVSVDRELFGLVRDDGRHGAQVRLFENESERRSLFSRWSEGMICLRGAHGLVAP